MSLPLNVEPSPQMWTSSDCMARTSIVPVTARPSGVVLKYTRPADRTWNAPHASAASPSSTSSRRQSTARASSAPYSRARAGTPEMSGSSYCPMSAVYVHGIAPLSRIHATATDVSRPPEKAIPTRSPTGREVRTLLTELLSSWERSRGSGRRLLGQRQESSGDLLAAVRVAAHHQHGVVAGDGAEDVGVLDLVHRRGQELGGARWGAEDDQVGAGVGTHQEPAKKTAEPVAGCCRLTGRGRTPVAALGRDGVHQGTRLGAHADRVQLHQVTRQRRLRHLDAAGH